MSVNDVRKNFVFKKEVAQHLEEIAKKNGKSMTTIVQELIEQKYQEVSKEEKLEALYEFANSDFSFPEELQGLTFKEIKHKRIDEKIQRCYND